jgi:hypothetical protein
VRVSDEIASYNWHAPGHYFYLCNKEGETLKDLSEVF